MGDFEKKGKTGRRIRHLLLNRNNFSRLLFLRFTRRPQLSGTTKQKHNQHWIKGYPGNKFDSHSRRGRICVFDFNNILVSQSVKYQIHNSENTITITSAGCFAPRYLCD
jgi:hypothetical protein